MDGSHAPHDALADWRASGADRVDPLRFHRIEALRRRASGLTGEARRAVDAKLAILIEEYAGALAQAGGTRRDDAPAAPARGALGELADLLARSTPAAAPPHAADKASPAGATNTGTDAAAAADSDAQHADTSTPRGLDAIQDFRRIWSDVRIRSQLRESLRPAPAGAGPLNSTRLVHRALALMQEASPGYLQHFMAYVDTLSCLEQMNAGTGEEACANAPRGKRARPRRRRG